MWNEEKIGQLQNDQRLCTFAMAFSKLLLSTSASLPSTFIHFWPDLLDDATNAHVSHRYYRDTHKHTHKNGIVAQ